MYEIKILPNRRLTTHLFCTHALRSSLKREIGTVVEPFRKKNNNVKPACHKIYQGKYYLLIFSPFSLFIFCCIFFEQGNNMYWHNDWSVAHSKFWISSKTLRATGWSKNAKIA